VGELFGWLMRLVGGRPAATLVVATPPATVAAPSADSIAALAAAVRPAAPSLDLAVGEEREAAAAPLLCRTEILDRDQCPLGYAFELREDLAGRIRAPGRRARDFLNGLLVEQLARYRHGAALRNRELCLRVWDGFLAQPVLECLAGLRVALLVQPENPIRAAGSETIVRVRRLQGLGMRIVLDHNDPGPWLDSLLPVADAVVFRMGFCVPEEVSLFARAVARQQPGVAVWAWDVGTHDDFDLARSAGCSAFSGGFVTRRDDWKGNSLSPHAARLASLLARLQHGVETQEIAQILKHDLALAYRLLRYVNAAGWGLNHHITSVEQAVVLLGREPLQRWVSMMLLGSARSVPGAGAVLEMALARARFLELLGTLRGERDPAAQLFVLGLFSLLDVALKVPIEDAIRPLKLSVAMQDAILARRGPMAPYLELALALEEGDAQRMKSFADVLGVEPGALAGLQFEALDWVQAAAA